MQRNVQSCARCASLQATASFCARTTSLQKVSGVKRRGISATFIGVLKRSSGISERYALSCASPFSVTMPFCSNSDSGRSPRAFSTILPRGILILNARSRRKTMSRKSIDSASSPSISETSSLTWSTSQPSASAIVSATLGNTAWISSLVIAASFAIKSLHFETAVHSQYLPRDVIRVRRGEKPNRPGYFLGLAVAPQQDLRFDRVAGELAHVGGHVGLDHARRHTVHRDLARSKLDRERSRERLDRALARRVIRLPASALRTRHRADVDDLAAAVNDHVRDYGTRHVEHSAD